MPLFRRPRVNRAKRTQFAAVGVTAKEVTHLSFAGADDGRVPCGTEGRSDARQGEICQTNPMCDGVSMGKERAM